MKKFTFIGVLAALLVYACSDDERFAPRTASEPGVRVGFRLEASADTGTSVEPMTRATDYKTCIRNGFRMLVLKKIDTRWVVDRTEEARFCPSLPASAEYYRSVLPDTLFSLTMRPGDYRLVAVLNPHRVVWNKALIPGTTVADEANPSLPVPVLVEYTVSSHWANNGYRMLSREIYVAVSDFTVAKTDNLHAAGMQPITLDAQRRVAKVRFLLKNTPSPVDSLQFDKTMHDFQVVFKATDKPLPAGIDALGGMYYGPEPLYELPWCLTTTTTWYPSGKASYLMTDPHATVFSPFVFAEPDVEIPVDIVIESIEGASGGYTYWTNEVFRRKLRASRITGVVLQTVDSLRTGGTQKEVEVTEATDSLGRPEDAATLFDPFFEWNAIFQ